MYETLAILISFVQAAQQEAARSGDSEKQARVQEMAGKILTSLTGTPAEKIRITETGLTLSSNP